ncbi:MAG: helix-turn-helix domain-containing protein [Ferruginibacter sp.]
MLTKIENPFEIILNRLDRLERLLINRQDVHAQPAVVESDEFLNVKDCAAFLKLSVPTIYSKVSLKELPVNKKGNRLYFSKKELTDYLKNGRVLTVVEMQQKAENYINKKSARS